MSPVGEGQAQGFSVQVHRFGPAVLQQSPKEVLLAPLPCQRPHCGRPGPGQVTLSRRGRSGRDSFRGRRAGQAAGAVRRACSRLARRRRHGSAGCRRPLGPVAARSSPLRRLRTRGGGTFRRSSRCRWGCVRCEALCFGPCISPPRPAPGARWKARRSACSPLPRSSTP